MLKPHSKALVFSKTPGLGVKFKKRNCGIIIINIIIKKKKINKKKN